MQEFGRKRPCGAVREEGVPLRGTDSPPNPPRGRAAQSAEKEWPCGPRFKGGAAQPQGQGPGAPPGWLYYQYCFFTFLSLAHPFSFVQCGLAGYIINTVFLHFSFVQCAASATIRATGEPTLSFRPLPQKPGI